MDVSQADNFIKIWWNLPFSNPKPDLFNVNAYSKFGENLLLFTQVKSPETKIWVCLGHITPSKIDEICPLAIPNQSPQYQCTYQVWWKPIDVYSSYHPERKNGWTDGCTTDGRTDRWTDSWTTNVKPLYSATIVCKMQIPNSQMMMKVLCFTSLSTLYISYPDNGKVIMIGSVQWSTVQSWAEFCLQTWNLWSEVKSTNHLDTSKKSQKKL